MPAENLPNEQNLLRVIDWNKMSRRLSKEPGVAAPYSRKGKIIILIGSDEGKSTAV